LTDSFQYPWDTKPAPAPTPSPPNADPDDPTPKAKRRGRRPASATMAAMSAAAPDWLYHHLMVSGPADILQHFAAAARGSGITPWQLDFAAIEEDIFVRAVSQPASQRNLAVEGCRILARQFREKVEMRQARAAALVGQSFACPFDLHALLPVPATILQLGPAHPDALSWLSVHWGVTDRLRQVAVRDNASTGRRLKRGHAVIGYGFFTDGDTPRAAIGHCEKRWPGLRFFLQPLPAD
jgi:hypothetical protein